MRTLILSCNTGGGHNSCAAALKDAYDAHGERCDIADALQFISPRASRLISGFHTGVYRRIPKLFSTGYQEAERHESIFRSGMPVYRYLASGAGRLLEYIEAGGYDNIICTHVFSALTMTALREEYSPGLTASFVSTDYTCSPGVAETRLDRYFIPAGLSGEFISCGVPEEKLCVSGIPARAVFYARRDKAAAREKLGLPADCRHLLMMCGSMGCGPIEELTELISGALTPGEILTVVCGSNEELCSKLRRQYGSRENVRIEGLVKDVPLLMQSADLFLTKPGGLSTTEAAASRLPMVLIDAVAGCEKHNLEYFLRLGAARTAPSPAALAVTALRLLEDKPALSAMSAACGERGEATPAELIRSQLSDICKEA